MRKTELSLERSGKLMTTRLYNGERTGWWNAALILGTLPFPSDTVLEPSGRQIQMP